MLKSSTSKSSTSQKNSFTSHSSQDAFIDLRPEQYWAMRSKGYQGLNWATDNKYIQFLLETSSFNPKDDVLDLGTGTGIIAHAIAPVVKTVLGIDISEEMLIQARANKRDNETFMFGDAYLLPRFLGGRRFDKIV